MTQNAVNAEPDQAEAVTRASRYEVSSRSVATFA
jgi:hypothetical protein